MLKNFRSYQMAVQFFRISEKVKGAPHLKDQLQRAASSIALNLSEGTERGSNVDRRRFYRMAMGSVRECQTILDLIGPENANSEEKRLADTLGASVFKLCKTLDLEIDRKPGPKKPSPRQGPGA